MSNDIPKDWTMRPLASLADYHNGRAFKPGELSKEGLPVIRIAQINNPSGEYDFYSGSDVSEKNLVRNGDLLFSWSATLTALIWNRGDAILNQHIFKVVEKEGVDKHFLHQLLANSIEALAEHSHGSTMKHIKKSVLSDYHVPVPELFEQQKIATILSSVDDVIEKTRARIDKLKDLKTGMMQELLTQGIGHTEFKDSPVGRIPVSWELVTLGEIAFWKGGGTPSKSNKSYWGGSIPWVSPKDMAERVITRTEDHITEAAVSESATNLINAGALLLVVRSGILRHTLPVAIAGCDLAINQDIKSLLVNDGMSTRYVFEYLSAKGQHVLQSTLKVGNTVESIDVGELSGHPIPCPPLEEQRAIAIAVKSVVDRIRAVESQLAVYEGLKKALMQDLLTGKVRVETHQKEPEVA